MASSLGRRRRNRGSRARAASNRGRRNAANRSSWARPSANRCASRDSRARVQPPPCRSARGRTFPPRSDPRRACQYRPKAFSCPGRHGGPKPLSIPRLQPPPPRVYPQREEMIAPRRRHWPTRRCHSRTHRRAPPPPTAPRRARPFASISPRPGLHGRQLRRGRPHASRGRPAGALCSACRCSLRQRSRTARSVCVVSRYRCRGSHQVISLMEVPRAGGPPFVAVHTPSLPHSLTHPLTHTHSYSLAHSLTHSLTQAILRHTENIFRQHLPPRPSSRRAERRRRRQQIAPPRGQSRLCHRTWPFDAPPRRRAAVLYTLHRTATQTLHTCTQVTTRTPHAPPGSTCTSSCSLRLSMHSNETPPRTVTLDRRARMRRKIDKSIIISRPAAVLTDVPPARTVPVIRQSEC